MIPSEYKTSLPLDFYRRDVLTVARELLGKILFKQSDEEYCSGKIVEVEAYDGVNDKAAHSYRGKTKRNEVMFDNGGRLYVYFIYGMHFCGNVVTGGVNEGSAVLLRALQPLTGIKSMFNNRGRKIENYDREIIKLCNGPAKICQAFDIDKKWNGFDLSSHQIFITSGENININNIVTTKRIGIKDSKELPWRFYIKDNPFISRK